MCVNNLRNLTRYWAISIRLIWSHIDSDLRVRGYCCSTSDGWADEDRGVCGCMMNDRGAVKVLMMAGGI